MELKATINWVHSSEFNRIRNRPYTSIVTVTFAAEWISNTGRKKEGLGDGYLQRERRDRSFRACGT